MAVQSVDWDVMRLQYELLHEDIAALAAENQISPVIVERAVRKGDWQRMAFKDVSQSFNEILAVDEITDEVLDKVETRVKILHALKRAALNPRLITLEAAIVSKAIEVAGAVRSDDALASSRLVALSKIVTEMRLGGVSASSANGADDTPRISVNIMNKVD